MKSNNLRISISFKNDTRDFKVFSFLQTKRDKSGFIKDLIEQKMLEEIKKEDHE